MKKMNLRLKAYDLVTATLVCFITTLIVSTAMAADDEAPPVDATPPVEDYRATNDLVELHYPIPINKSYKERRETSGWMFGLNYENVMLDRYVSILDFTTFYQDLFGETEFPVYNINFNYKYNFILGSLTAGVGMSHGQINDNSTGVEKSLTITEVRGEVGYIMDNILDEPYVAPYVAGGLMNIGITEKSGDTSATHGMDYLMYYKVGVLLQLDWLDPVYSKRNIRDYGLQNTYLDLFISKYEPSSNADDPDTSTDYMYGAGIRLEF